LSVTLCDMRRSAKSDVRACGQRHAASRTSLPKTEPPSAHELVTTQLKTSLTEPSLLVT
jgi:hypothetical protein